LNQLIADELPDERIGEASRLVEGRHLFQKQVDVLCLEESPTEISVAIPFRGLDQGKAYRNTALSQLVKQLGQRHFNELGIARGALEHASVERGKTPLQRSLRNRYFPLYPSSNSDAHWFLRVRKIQGHSDREEGD
jgi:hypothetical protein